MHLNIFAELEALPAPALLIDLDGLIIFANTCAQRYLSVVDITDMPVVAFVRDWRHRSGRSKLETRVSDVIVRSGESAPMQIAVFEVGANGQNVTGLVLLRRAGGPSGR